MIKVGDRVKVVRLDSRFISERYTSFLGKTGTVTNNLTEPSPFIENPLFQVAFCGNIEFFLESELEKDNFVKSVEEWE